MAQELKVDISLDLSNLEAGLEKVKKTLSDFGKKASEDLKIKPNVDTAGISIDMKKANAILDAANKTRVSDAKKTATTIEGIEKTSSVKKLNNTKLYTNLTKTQINSLIKNAEELGKKTTKALKFDIAANQVNMNKWSESIRKVGITVLDTGKKLDKLGTERYIKFGLEKNKLEQDIKLVTARISTVTAKKRIPLEIEIGKTVEQINAIKNKITTLKTDVEKGAKFKIQLQNEEKLKALRLELATIKKQGEIKINLDTKAAKTSVTELGAKMKNLQTSGTELTSRFQKGFTSLGTSVKAGLFSTFGVLSVGGALASGIRSVITEMGEAKKVALERESAFTGVQKTLDGTTKEFASLKTELVSLTKEIPLTFQEISKIAELGGQMGVPIADINEFTKAVAQIGSTTNLSIEDAATQFARLHNVMQEPLDTISKTASAVVDLGNNFAAQESEILDFTSRIAGAGKVIGATIGDLTGIGAAFTSVGVKSERGGSAVSKAMLIINDAVVKGGDEMVRFAEVSGIGAEEFKTLREEDAGEAFTLFVEGLQKSGNAANSIIEELLGNNILTKSSFLSMAGAGSLLREAIEKGNSAYETNNALVAEAALRYGTAESQFKLLSNAYDEQQAILGEKLIPTYQTLEKAKLSLLKGITSLITWMDNLGVSVKTVATILGAGLVAVLFAISAPLAIVAIAVGGVTTALTLRGGAADDAATELDKLKGSMQELGKKSKQLEEDERELIQSYIDGKISVEEYRLEINKLIEEKKKLAGEIQKNIDRQEVLAFVQKKIAKNEKEANTRLKESQKIITEYNKANDTLEKKKEKIYKQTKKDIAQGKNVEKAYKDQEIAIGKLVTELNNKQQAAISAQKSSEKAVLQNQYESEVLGLLEETYDNVEDAKDAYDSIKIDSSSDVGQINAATAAAEAMRKKMIEALDVKIALLGADVSGAKANQKGNVFQGFFAALTGSDVETSGLSNKAAAQLKVNESNLERLIKLRETYNEEGSLAPIFKDGLNAATAEANGIEKSFGDIAKGSPALKKQLKEVNDLLNSGKLSAEGIKIAREKQGKIQTALNKAIKEEQEAIKAGGGSTKRLVDLKEQQLEIAKQQYAQDLKYADDIYADDIQKAKAVMDIKAGYEEKIKEIEGNTHESIIEHAEEIIAKQEELKEKGQDAYDAIGDSITDVASELSDIAEDMADVNKELEDINTEAIEDIQKRYAEIGGEIIKADDDIQKLESDINKVDDTTKDLETSRKDVTKEITDSQKSIDDYEKNITKINESLSDLNTDTTDSLAERYVEIGEELISNQDALDVLNAKATLTTAEAKKKLELEKEITDLTTEQALAQGQVSAADITRQTTISGESETEKLIRERDEKNAAYKLELADLQVKLVAEQQVKSDAQIREQELKSQLDQIEIDENKAKLDVLNAQLEEAYAVREALIREKLQAEAQLTDEQQKEALDKEAQTKIQGILDQRAIDTNEAKIELDRLKQLNEDKLAELRQYYIDAYNLKVAGRRDFGEAYTFTDFDTQGTKNNLDKANVSDDFGSSLTSGLAASVSEQKDATSKLEKLSGILDILIKNTQNDNDKMFALLKKVTELRDTANLSEVLDQRTLNTITQQNSFSVNNGVDAASMEAYLRRSLKI